MLDAIKEILEGCNKNVAVLAVVGSLIVGKSVLNVSSFFGKVVRIELHKVKVNAQ